MRFYNCQHRHYCGIDLHVKTMYVCILDATGQVLIHRTIKSTPEAFLGLVAPIATILSWPPNACSRGTGSPTSALAKASTSSSVTRSP
jgi:predicted NBD/HSP70 family sugar kinase